MGGIAACLCMACGGNDSKDYWGDTSGGEDEEPTENPNASKPRYIWIDAAANFPDFANSKENIARDLALAKDAGFTDIVVDVRPTTGDVLFKTNLVDQVKFMYAWIGSNYTKVERTATWDYLQAFVTKHANRGFVFMLPSILLSVEIKSTGAQDYCIETSLRQSGQHR